jgi:hypothetical protein
MSQPNPFADEPQVQQAVRWESAADPLDPYAAPGSGAGVAGEYHPALTPGIGLWRQDHELVIHSRAGFPPRCVITNEATDDLQIRRLAWAHPFDIGLTQQLMVRYAISPRGMRGLGHGRLLAIAVAISSLFGAGCFWWMTWKYIQAPLFGPLPFLLLLFFAVLLSMSFVGSTKLAFDAKRPLKLVARGGEYLWIIGAGPEFLASLPRWPRLKEFQRP